MKFFVVFALLVPLLGFASSHEIRVAYKPFTSIDSERRELLEEFFEKSCRVPAGAVFEEYLSGETTRSSGAYSEIETRRHEFLVKFNSRVIDHLHILISKQVRFFSGAGCDPSVCPPPEFFEGPDVWIDGTFSTQGLCK